MCAAPFVELHGIESIEGIKGRRKLVNALSPIYGIDIYWDDEY